MPYFLDIHAFAENWRSLAIRIVRIIQKWLLVGQALDKRLEELSSNPFLGERLGNKFNIDLTGYYKIYVNSKRHRIVYRLVSPENIEIIEVWGIGKRDKEEIYRTIGNRIVRRK